MSKIDVVKENDNILEGDYSPKLKEILTGLPKRLLVVNVLLCILVVVSILGVCICMGWPEEPGKNLLQHLLEAL